MQSTSTLGSRISKSELSDASTTEARAVAKQAIDAISSTEALTTLKSKLQGESISAPLSSMRDLAGGRKWLDGTIKLDARSSPEDVKVLQRALMKIGAHHPQGRADASLMLLPWGADGSLGQGTLKAVDAALRIAGKANLTPVANHLPLNRDVANAITSRSWC